jgi:Zn-dependent protease
MLPTRNGSIKFFRFRGIDVFVHWSWFLVAMFSVYDPRENYASPIWVALEYLALFAIVLMHEFGHSLACRQVGGQADQIILWPLGGVAYVNPPQRPGATLWSIAAGPLINVALLPILTFLYFRAGYWHLPAKFVDLPNFVFSVWMINNTLLIFNLLPVYPLDGGANSSVVVMVLAGSPQEPGYCSSDRNVWCSRIPVHCWLSTLAVAGCHFHLCSVELLERLENRVC